MRNPVYDLAYTGFRIEKSWNIALMNRYNQMMLKTHDFMQYWYFVSPSLIDYHESRKTLITKK